MYTFVKTLIIIYILSFIFTWITDIIKDFTDTRTITVMKVVPKPEMKELKGYHISDISHFEQADVKVQPGNFSDYLLLTSDKGNIASIALNVLALTLLGWYVFKLKVDNLFSPGSYKRASGILLLLLFSAVMTRVGLNHTIEFWQKHYWQSEANLHTTIGFSVVDNFNLSLYCIVIWAALLLYGYFGRYYSRMPVAIE